MKSGIEMGAGMEQQEKNEIRLELPEKVRQIIAAGSQGNFSKDDRYGY